MAAPVSEYYPFGLLVKSWATGLDYFTTAFSGAAPPTQPPTKPVAGEPWALPAWQSVPVPIAGNPKATAIANAVAMTWVAFEDILHHANNVAPLGAITNPTNATNVLIVQDTGDTLVLRLPSMTRLQQSEATLLGGAAYPVPPFYDDLYKELGWTRPASAAPSSFSSALPGGVAAVLKLEANRIGDYTMSRCD
jgi:hypothetical protein